MTPSPPVDVTVNVHLAPLSGLVGYATVEGEWKEGQPARSRNWRALIQPVVNWKPRTPAITRPWRTEKP